MADHSLIEWTDATWNPVTGCSVVSPGCTNCYAMRLAGTRMQHHPSRAGLTEPSKAGPVWNGDVRLNQQWLTQPLAWKRPRRIFVCAHGDLFHESVPDAWIDQVFAVMALAPRHTFQVLTKRAARMRDYVGMRTGDWQVVLPDACAPGSLPITKNDVERALGRCPKFSYDPPTPAWPLPNVWLGVSAEDQVRADERIPQLLATPAAVRFLSAEPLLGPISLSAIDVSGWREVLPLGAAWLDRLEPGEAEAARLDWVIAGGESGPGARPMHPDWARQLRDDCAAAGVPFFFKQWGEWTPGENVTRRKGVVSVASIDTGGLWFSDLENLADTDGHVDDEPDLYRVGKKAAGRRLDGREHSDFPKVGGHG